jgi:hypothetical protein
VAHAGGRSAGSRAGSVAGRRQCRPRAKARRSCAGHQGDANVAADAERLQALQLPLLHAWPDARSWLAGWHRRSWRNGPASHLRRRTTPPAPPDPLLCSPTTIRWRMSGTPMSTSVRSATGDRDGDPHCSHAAIEERRGDQ